jgi:hypothetical protein
VRGSRARLGLLMPPIEDLDAVRATVGKFLGILTTESLLIGVITNVSIEPPACADEHGCQSTADLDLIGEIRHSTTPARFQRGVTNYPAIGDPVLAVSARELRLVYNDASNSAVAIGHLQQDSSIAAYVDLVLAATRIRYAQGYHFAKPFLLEDVVKTSGAQGDE